MTATNADQALKVLVEHAEGRQPHLNMGFCPDAVEGTQVRDPDCKVCQALDAVGGAIHAQKIVVHPRVLSLPGQTFSLDLKTMDFVQAKQ